MSRFERAFTGSMSAAIPKGVEFAERMTERKSAEARQKQQDALAEEQRKYQREQDRISNFYKFGGYDPEAVIRGSSAAYESPMLIDADLARFQQLQAKSPTDYVSKSSGNRPYTSPASGSASDVSQFQAFREMIAGKGKSSALSFEQRKELERLHAEETRRTKASPTYNKYAGMGAKPEPLKETGGGSWFSRIFGGKKEPKKDTLGLLE